MKRVEFFKKVLAQKEFLKTSAVQFTNDNEEAIVLIEKTILIAMAQIDNYQNNSTVCGWLYTIMKTGYIQQYKELIRSGKKMEETDAEFVNVASVKVLTRSSLKMEGIRNFVSTSKSIKHSHSELYPRFIQD